jgi:hypothetical protein
MSERGERLVAKNHLRATHVRTRFAGKLRQAAVKNECMVTV